MTAQSDQEAFAPLLADVLRQFGAPIAPSSTADYLDLIEAASGMERASRRTLHETVAAAHASGVSWAAVGARLNMSRQAAQQRFSVRNTEIVVPEGTEQTRTLGPVTAFDEIRELNLAGQQGWHSIGFGLLHHLVQRSETQWEHQRTAWLPGVVDQQRRQGWQLIGTTFPWAYFKRDLGLPALPAPPDPPQPAMA